MPGHVVMVWLSVLCQLFPHSSFLCLGVVPPPLVLQPINSSCQSPSTPASSPLIKLLHHKYPGSAIHLLSNHLCHGNSCKLFCHLFLVWVLSNRDPSVPPVTCLPGTLSCQPDISIAQPASTVPLENKPSASI